MDFFLGEGAAEKYGTKSKKNSEASSDSSKSNKVTISDPMLGILYGVDSGEVGWWESVGWRVFNGNVGSGTIDNYSNTSVINTSNGSNTTITNHKVESGIWEKIYKDGYDANGKKISIHYFQSESGKVFDVKTKSGWSNN
ncbi:hypothetical protein LY28_00176 [Ruminiclostridium sufflavum DSM 19573]|uniref:Uncharacterized protein n=1 Tax=Ruminiclostridium sufflavum DSM 19573 TaxID=1121337 RepID=A0A318XQD7_9FIRM|nr:hypothetical protein [Ruminiclostridium sufflavum]PYG90295.1 hypothetical protein LY28_00176 [Ruminiclostridium sufflavum DSM 19573]